MVGNDNKYKYGLEKLVLDNTNINEIYYVNYYDEHYIILDEKMMYLFDNEFNLIESIKKEKLFKDYDKYDIVYINETIMFMDSYKNKEGLIFKYYDIYTGDCIDEIILGGSYE